MVLDAANKVLDAAREYLDRGWFPVPLPPRAKGAVLKDWPKLRLTESQLADHFVADSNVGLILGEASGWLVDVDLDCPEAIELADEFLPPTNAVTGRPSAPRSHRWYVSQGAEPVICDLPPRVMEAAAWWAKYSPSGGNLDESHPVPATVEYTAEALEVLVEGRREADQQYSLAQSSGDPVGTTVWGRVNEQTRKLALLYAISENFRSPRVTAPGARWARSLVGHQTRRMLFMVEGHVAENPFHKECLKVIQKLRDAPGNELTHSVLLKRMKVDAQTFQKIIQTLMLQGDVVTDQQPTAGRTRLVYRLANR